MSYQEKKEFQSIESEMADLGNRKSTIEALFVNQEVPKEDISTLSVELQQINHQIEQLEERWLELSLKME